MVDEGAQKRMTPAAGAHTTWKSTLDPPALTPGEVHVWRAGLALPAATMASLHRLLSGDEQSRAARFLVEPPRQQYIAAHGILRVLLSRYTGTSPCDLRFQYGSHGKPALDAVALEFNMAHSHRLAVYAFALHTPVGVDLEHVKPDVDIEGITAHFFSAGEAATLRTLAPEQRRPWFFERWTAKEAILKAAGIGLTPRLEIPDGWHAQPFDAGDGYAAALATASPDVRVTFYDFGAEGLLGTFAK
ncbi:MAG: 4'-phosphopantetheinyl transferase superfamily protein [Anaerolineae bacterium]|nr:4'-phosphopantetheinyl transferase superfamily protein [Anaerolineae bacterium]